MVRDMKNIVGVSSTSSFNNYLANGSSSSIKNLNNINKSKRLQSSSIPQPYYHRTERNGIKQIVKETQNPKAFNKNLSFNIVPQSNPTNFDSINNLYKNICKNYDINTNNSVAIDIPNVSNEIKSNEQTEKLNLVQGELDKIDTIRNQINSIQIQLQYFNGEGCNTTLTLNGTDYYKYKNFIKETKSIIDQLQQLNSFNFDYNSKQSSSNLASLKSALTPSNNTTQIYDILSSSSFHSFAIFKKTFANGTVNQPLKNYEKFVDLINENFYVQKEINQKNLSLQRTNQMFSMITQRNLDGIQVIIREGIVQVKELENNLLQMEKSAITTSGEVEVQTDSIEKINQSITKTNEILEKLKSDYKRELKEHEKIINYHKRIIDSIENSKRHVSILTDVSIICFSIWLSNKFVVKYPIDLMAQSITKSKIGQKIIAVIMKITLIILISIQIRKFLKANDKYNLIQYCFDLILSYHKKKYIEDKKSNTASLESINDSNETLVDSSE